MLKKNLSIVTLLLASGTADTGVSAVPVDFIERTVGR